jgi:hypothetical protein
MSLDNIAQIANEFMTRVDGLQPGEQAAGLVSLSAALEANGVTSDVLKANAEALARGGSAWTHFVAAYGSDKFAPVSFFVAPTRVPETEKRSTLGYALLQRDTEAETQVASVENGLRGSLGETLFGSPLTTQDRRIEFFRVLGARWNRFNVTHTPIAFFTPFNFAEYEASPAMASLRRTQMLSNVTLDRHLSFVRPIAARQLLIDGLPPGSLRLSDSEINGGIAVWLYLHEIMHLNGPFPLFGTALRKLDLGLVYAPLEEFRVDASVCLGLLTAGELNAPTASVVEIILMERLLRSAEQRNASSGSVSKVEHLHGRMWRNVLAHHGALTVDSHGVFNISTERLRYALGEVLQEIYHVEASAIGHEHASARRVLVDMASAMAETYQK